MAVRGPKKDRELLTQPLSSMTEKGFPYSHVGVATEVDLRGK